MRIADLIPSILIACAYGIAIYTIYIFVRAVVLIAQTLVQISRTLSAIAANMHDPISRDASKQ